MADSDSGTDQQFNRKMVSADRNRHMPNVSAYDTRRGCLNFRVRGAWRLFPRVAVGACDEPTAAVGKSVLFLRSSLGETIFPQDRKLIHRLLPVLGRTAPIGCDVSQRQPNQFRRRIVSGEMPACLDDLAHARALTRCLRSTGPGCRACHRAARPEGEIQTPPFSPVAPPGTALGRLDSALGVGCDPMSADWPAEVRVGYGSTLIFMPLRPSQRVCGAARPRSPGRRTA